ncbi:hypothetical protein [Oceanisphaera sp. IT1-181]|uniref:hypothetical protein n=1 Tax=Oceanisphaera sp. IT1-181 TaxID=3081199 RepID=UPI0029CA9BBF|nr:hypothetical protein [Oceanisphaera sp. IT1-181]
MKKFIIAPVAAVVMLGLSGTAFASASENGSHGTGVDIYKNVEITNKIDYKGHAHIGGYVGINQLGMAVIDSYQNTTDNEVRNTRNENNASVSGGSANNLKGNSGVNVAAGDNNVQANNTAITALGNPSRSLWGDKGASVDAEIGSTQVSALNKTYNIGNHNNASISGGSLNGSAGNLGANVASGNGNVQANNFAVSYGKDTNLAVSTVDNKQFTTGNYTLNETQMKKTEGKSINMSLSGKVNGTYNGNSEQSNDVYPEIWQGPSGQADQNHPGGQDYWGHADFDRSPDDAGVESHFKFAENGDIDLGTVTLSGNLAVVNHIVGRTNVNNASISGGSLNNAAGNIGVNVASGTNNLQSNSMALSVGNM